MSNVKQISIFLQRQIEAQLLKPVIEGLAAQFGEEEVITNVRTTIEKIAFDGGRKLAEDTNDNSLSTMAEYWQKLAEGDALTMENLKLSDSKLSFSITRCKYAEYYKQLKAVELGNTLSCCRDNAFLSGFSNNIEMIRSKSILEGNSICDFVYEYTDPDKK